MQAALGYALEYVHERHQISQLIRTFQLLQGKIGDVCVYEKSRIPISGRSGV